MPWTDMPLVTLVTTAAALASVALLAAGAPAMSSNSLPLSYVLADTAFLADEVSSISDAEENWSSRVAEYLSLVQRTLGMNSLPMAPEPESDDADEDAVPNPEASRSKRQLPTDRLSGLTKDPEGVYLLKTPMLERFTIPAKFPNDIVLFRRAEGGVDSWYAAALEADGEHPQTSLANALVLYKLLGSRFLEQARVPAFGASALAVQDIDGWTYLVASERMAQHRDKPQGGSILYRLSLNGRNLVPVETLETAFPSDLTFWEFSGSHYLAVATEFSQNSSGISWAADTLVYKWYGEHLDIIQRLPTSGAKAVTAFTIGSNQYLAVVNHIDDSGETNIDSTVYRFDLAREQFVVHQRLRTHAAVDVAFFTMNRARGQDYFLVIANSYYQGADLIKNTETNSVLYRWSEGFFVPFQSFKLTGALHWTPVLGPRGETVLLGADAYGLHAYQYDGWRFQHQQLATGRITSLRAVVFEREVLLVVASKDGDGSQVNVFSLQFERIEPLHSLYDDLHRWCEGKLAEVQASSVDELLRRVESAPKWDQPVVQINSVTFESDSTVHVVTVNSTRVIDPAYVMEVNDLAATLQSTNQKLLQAEETMRLALKKEGDNFFNGRLVLDNATVICPDKGCWFEQAQVRLLNNEDADDLVTKTVRLDSDLNLSTLYLESATVPGDLVTRRVLGVDAPLVSLVDTKTIMGSLDVDELRIDTALDIDGVIDGVRISPDTVVIKSGDQKLPDIASTAHWQINKLNLRGLVNGMQLDVSKPTPPDVDVHVGDTHLEALVVQDVNLGGLLGDVDIRRVNQYALRTHGKQVVTGDHTFAKLKVHSAHSLNGPNVESVVRTDRDEVLPGTLQFTRPVQADEMQVYKRLVHVGVAKDGSMDLLLRRSRGGGAQHVTGAKRLRRLAVTEEARVHGRVLGLVLPAEDEDLVTVIREDKVITGDVTISGHSDIAGLVYANDIVDPGSGSTLLEVLKYAVPLTAPLPANVKISDLEVTSNLEVKNLNGVQTSSWIQDRPDLEVFLSSPATFDGDLTVTKSSKLTGKVNHVDLVELATTSLLTTGDQVIPGFKKFPSVTTTAVWSNDTMFGSTRWEDQWDEQPVDDVVRFENNLEVDGDLLLKRLHVEGSLGGFNITKMLQDSVFKDSGAVTVIDGPKTFTQTVKVDHLRVDPKAGGNIPHILHQPKHPEDTEKVFEFPNGVTIGNPLSVSRLSFSGTLDRIPDQEWSAPWLEYDGDQTLYGPQHVHGNVVAHAGVQAGSINTLDITRFAETVARIDDPELALGSVVFENGLVARGPVTAGSVDGVDLSDALLARGAFAQEVRGRMVLAGGLETGSLSVVGNLAGENFKQLCEFFDPPTTSLNTPQMLTVEGNLHLDEEPVLKDINGLNLNKLLLNTWLRDRPAGIEGELSFGDVQFTNDVSVEDRIDGVNLDAIAARYLSLTRGGAITTKLNVLGGLLVQGNLVANDYEGIIVDGKVGDVKLSDFATKVLLDGPDQDVIAHMDFGVVSVAGDLKLDGTVNGMNLSRDVVQNLELPWALQHNVITERKTVRNLHVSEFAVGDESRVQGVDLNKWRARAVRTTGDYTVDGAKTLYSPNVVGDMTVDGLVGGMRVDAQSLLLRHSDQVVRGAKTLRPALLPGLGLRVTDLSVGGRVNDVDMRALLNNQAYRTADVQLFSPVDLMAPLRAQNVQLDGLFQGVNVSELIYEAHHPPGLDLYTEQHRQLLNKAEHVQQSLKAQGYYLNYYHTAVEFRSSVRAILPLGKAASTPGDVEDEAYAVAVVREAAPGRNLELHFYSWSAQEGMLVRHPTLGSVSLPSTVRLIAPARYAGQNAMYWETDERSGVHHGSVVGLMRDGYLGHAKLLQDTLPSAWVSVTMVGDMSCLIRGSPGVGAADGFCSLHCLSSGRDDVVRAALPVSRPTHATSLTVRGVPHVFVASGVSEESEGEVSVWTWDAASGALRSLQRLGVVNATAVAAVEHRGMHYLASASGHVEDAPHNGMVHISRFDADSGRWRHWVSVDVEGPAALHFDKLPSDELALYVSTTCPTDSLVVFLYRGMSGFVRRASAAVPLHGVLSAFTTAQHQHVVAVSGGVRASQASLLQASFKGSWEASDIAFRSTAVSNRGRA
ncbi:Thrombospondin-type laminin G domain and EAR repeat-containing protein [Frankliniella fusca]|uniref:Thrombospondin-type laminin G domain and EAR repeat-containing protein n=1 Tax=Frankliniella fusca TaxID=407009 RepID=A0AAE1HEV2_9NEOP|nr:Thrombospondin-type laminin G domain and EAR repeat-containing protein [Frankliniella fusca]